MERQLEWPWGPRHRRRARRRRRRLTERVCITMMTSEPEEGLHDWTLYGVKAIARRARYGLDRIYQWAGLLCRVRAAAVGTAARVETLDEDSLRQVLSEVADFAEVRKNAKGAPTVRMLAPPYEVLKNILSLPAYDEGVTRRPLSRIISS